MKTNDNAKVISKNGCSWWIFSMLLNILRVAGKLLSLLFTFCNIYLKRNLFKIMLYNLILIVSIFGTNYMKVMSNKKNWVKNFTCSWSNAHEFIINKKCHITFHHKDKIIVLLLHLFEMRKFFSNTKAL